MLVDASNKEQVLPVISHIKSPSANGKLDASFLRDATKIRDLWPLVQNAASDPTRKDRPFAEDEFYTEDDFTSWAKSGYVVKFTNEVTQNIEAYGFLTASWYHRIHRPLYADMRIFTVDLDPSQKLLEFLLSSLEQIAECIGFYGTILDVLSCNLNGAQAARKLGYENFLILSSSGRIPLEGLIESMIFFKIFNQDKPLPTPDDKSIQHLPETHLKNFERRPNVDMGFPLKHVMDDGTEVIVMYMKERHVKLVHQMFQDAVNRGKGYGMQELPPLELWESVLHCEVAGQCVVAEIGGKPAGAMFVCPNVHCRSMSPELADSWMVIDPNVASKGMGTFFHRFWLKMAYMLGYKGCFSETFLNNVPIIKIVRRTGCTFVGTLRKVGYLEGKGYRDGIFAYKGTYANDPDHPVLSKL